VLIDRENKIALITDTAVPLTHSLPSTEARKITKREILALEIKNVWKLNDESVCPLVISVEGAVTRNVLKYLQYIGLTKNILRIEQLTVPLHTCHIHTNF